MKPGTDTLGDAELLDRMLSLDDRAWGEFHKRYDRLIWCCIQKVAGRFGSVFRPDDAREVYAVFFASLLANDMRKVRSFDPARGNKLGTWVGLLVMHATYDHLRAFARHPVWEPLSAAEDIPDPDDPFQWLSRREEQCQIADLVETFPASDQAFVRMHFINGDDPEEIAAALGLALKTVYTKKHKIKVRFERLLAALRLDAAA